MRALRQLAALTMFVLSGPTLASSIDIQDGWRDQQGGFSKSALPGVGFSFKYNGRTIGPIFTTEWNQSTVADASTGKSTTTLAHNSGLVVVREMRVFPSAGAIEYRIRLKNSAKTTLPPISSLQVINVSFDTDLVDDSCVVSSGGGIIDTFLPPRSFDVRKRCFAPTVPGTPSAVELEAEGGRSSGRDLPFFFIQNDVQQEGLFVALGWSGQWGALVQRNSASGALNIRGRIPGLEIALEPDEEIQGPTILLGHYQGSLTDGSNRLRRLIRDEYTPTLNRARYLPVATYDNWFGTGDRFDESLLEKLASEAAEIGQEYFLLDAGWYDGKSWFTSVGNWDRVDKSRLSRGLNAAADFVRSKGLKFGLWFEPERVAAGSLLAEEHPDWVLWDYGKVAAPWFGHAPWLSDLNEDSGSEFFTKRFGLLDYGRPEVQAWVKDLLDRYIRDYGIKYIRYDLNLDPLPYWDANDKPGRRGVTQIRHIQGLYAVIDWIRTRHPDTILEGCASGGRRIDLETARRFHTYWLTDYTIDPSVVRYNLFGINYFLPGNYHYIQYVLPYAKQKNFHADDLGFQSLFGGAFGIGGRIDLWPEGMKDKAKRHVEIWKKIRRYLVEDYYALSAQPSDLESWSGWQFQDPADHSGFVQTFRTKTTNPSHRFKLHKLDTGARYRFSDAYGTYAFEVTGSTAMAEGIDFPQQQPMSSSVFIYREISAHGNSISDQ